MFRDVNGVRLNVVSFGDGPRTLLATGMSARDVADALAVDSKRPRREIYQVVLAVKT